MPNPEPKLPYTIDAVRSGAPANDDTPAGLSPIARQVAMQYSRDTSSPVMVSGWMRVAELVLSFVTGLAIYVFYVGTDSELSWHYPVIVAAGSLLTVLMLEFNDSYQMSTLRRPGANFGSLLLVWSGTFALLALAGFFVKMSADFSRVWFASWYVGGFALMFSLRLVMARLIRRWSRNGRIERRAVIVGGGKQAETLIRSIEKQPDNDIRICGIFDDRDDRRSPPVVAGYPKLGTISALIEFARIARIDMLIVSLPITAESRVLSMLKKLWVLPVDIRLSAHSNQLKFRPRAYSYIGSVPMLDVFDRPIHDWDSVAKRAFDIVFSLAAIVAFSPIMLADRASPSSSTAGDPCCSSRSATASTTR